MEGKGHSLVDSFKVFWIGLWAAVATLVVFLPVTVAALLSRTGNLAFTLSKVWARIMLAATGVRVEIRGKEKIRPGQSHVIISNHQSEYDILAIVTTLGIQYRWIIKKELRHVPLFGYALYASRNIFIDRGDHEQAMQSIRHGLERLPEGVSVLFFAEGTRSADGSIAPFKKGGFLVALEKGLPILPVTVNGSRRVLPKKSLVFHPGPIEVVVADPIDTIGYTRETLQDLVDRTRGVIVANFNPGYPFPKSVD
ncbi:MAG TPA: lysophospholipid acyltransferase family protein [Deltaproteobacteria bacterium]|nr:lysophospholipid acyltransferase family protein [Deltaproteobacteria bacterium]HQI80948.1 lysophospholipid acyltransferase family protein [Deltaproteobacteria bacterium]